MLDEIMGSVVAGKDRIRGARTTPKLRVLALNWRCLRHPQAGGSEINLFEQARRWVRDGYQVTIVCADPGREYATSRDEIDDGIVVRRMGGRLSVYARAAWFLLRHGHKYDVILDVANGIPFFSPLFTGTPSVLLVHHVHGRQWFSEFSWPFAAVGWFLEKHVVRRVYHRSPVIAVSPTTQEALVAIGVPESSVRIVYNGTKLPDPEAVASPISQANIGRHRIAYVGRLKRYKRVERLLHAVANLRAEFPNVQLDIVGSGDARPAIEDVIRRLGLQGCVKLHGFVSEQTKSTILRRATVFAMPSMHEGWGLSVIEANGHGCPAVAYDVPGLRVAVKHGVTGLLAQDDESFEQAIGTLLRDENLRQRYSEAARDWAEQFSWDACANATIEVLAQCTRPRGLRLISADSTEVSERAG